MRHSWFSCVLSAVALPCVLLFPVATLAADPAPLPVDTVTISATGLAMLTHPFAVDAKTPALTLPVRQRDINDVLKTLVVLSDTVRLHSISLAGSDPLALPVAPHQMQSLPALLQATRGETISISGKRTLTGRIASVAAEPATDARPLRHRVTLFSAEGLDSFILEDIDRLRFRDARLNQAVQHLLDTAALQQPQAVADLAVRLETPQKSAAQGRLAYLLALPMWKAAYRLVLPPEGGGNADGKGGKGTLQALAVIENSSPLDWNGVRLTLLSGAPVTLSQDLYGSHYRDRLQLALPDTASPVPEADQGAVAMLAERAATAGDASGSFKAMARMEAPAPVAASPAQAVETPFDARYTLADPVTIASGMIAAVPFATARVPAEQVAFYQPATHAMHPYTAVRLVNDSSASLPPGILTVYADAPAGAAYLGDAALTALPQGEARLLPFALDRKIRIVADPKHTESLSRVTWTDGVLQAVITERQVTVYRVQSTHTAPVTLLVEHPRPAGLTLKQPGTGVEVTESSWRFRVPLQAGEQTTVQVVATRPVARQYSFVAGDMGWPALQQLSVLLEGSGDVPGLDAADATFRQLAGLERDLEDRNTRQQRLYQEQERLRQNLQAVGNDGDLGRRYRSSLAQQEDELARIAKEADALRARRQQLIQQLGQQLAAVKWPE